MQHLNRVCSLSRLPQQLPVFMGPNRYIIFLIFSQKCQNPRILNFQQVNLIENILFFIWSADGNTILWTGRRCAPSHVCNLDIMYNCVSTMSGQPAGLALTTFLYWTTFYLSYYATVVTVVKYCELQQPHGLQYHARYLNSLYDFKVLFIFFKESNIVSKFVSKFEEFWENIIKQRKHLSKLKL